MKGTLRTVSAVLMIVAVLFVSINATMAQAKPVGCHETPSADCDGWSIDLTGPGDGWTVQSVVGSLSGSWAPGETYHSYSLTVTWEKVFPSYTETINRGHQGNVWFDCPEGYTVGSNTTKCVRTVPERTETQVSNFSGSIDKPSDCVVTPVCGNSVVEAPEACDDGNTVDGDGCSATCTVEARKVYVCKYVGTPHFDERLQDGQNPIEVSVNAIPGDATVGSYFNDAHGQSFVLGFVPMVPEPTRADCPSPDEPDLCDVTTRAYGTWSDWVVNPANTDQEMRTQPYTDYDATETEHVCGAGISTEYRERTKCVYQTPVYGDWSEWVLDETTGIESRSQLMTIFDSIDMTTVCSTDTNTETREVDKLPYCYEGKTEYYYPGTQPAEATEGECPVIENVTICYKGTTMTVPENTLDKYPGYDKGACPVIEKTPEPPAQNTGAGGFPLRELGYALAAVALIIFGLSFLKR